MAANQIDFNDYIALSEVVFEWVDSYDTKVRAERADLNLNFNVASIRTGKDFESFLPPISEQVPPLPVAVVRLNIQQIDYSKLNGKTWEAMPANEFIVMVSGPEMFGSKLLRTQHLIGASKWEKKSNTEIHGIHQMRSRSLRSADVDSGATASETERSTVVEHLYLMVDGQWKLAGIKPSLR